MSRRRFIVTVLADFGFGFLAFVLVRVLLSITGQQQDIRLFLLTTFFAFAAAALYRGGRPEMRNWHSFLAVLLGGIFPALTLRLLRMSLTARGAFVLFLMACVCAVAVGTILKSLLRSGKGITALTMGCLVTLAIAGFAYKLVPEWLDRDAYALVNQAVAPFSVTTLGGEKVTSGELRGKVVVLAFWATWCLPCQAELPRIQALSKRYSGNPRVLILAVDAGTEGDTPEKVRSYLVRKRLDLPVAMDSLDGERSGPAARSLQVPSLPALYVMDAMGRLRIIHLGYYQSEDLERSLSRLIDGVL